MVARGGAEPTANSHGATPGREGAIAASRRREAVASGDADEALPVVVASDVFAGEDEADRTFQPRGAAFTSATVIALDGSTARPCTLEQVARRRADVVFRDGEIATPALAIACFTAGWGVSSFSPSAIVSDRAWSNRVLRVVVRLAAQEPHRGRVFPQVREQPISSPPPPTGRTSERQPGRSRSISAAIDR